MTPAPSCSIVVPAKNEKGTIEPLVRSMPRMGTRTEIVFVEGGSSDGTRAEIERVIAACPDREVKLVRQDGGAGKADALRRGFAAATGDVFIVFDADLTVAPGALPAFYGALDRGEARFVSGTRLVRPMEDGAMPFLNRLGNLFFRKIFGWLLGRPVSDTLCGTKAFWREDYLRMKRNPDLFGALDPFGDFELLFGAARLGLPAVEIPVDYRARVYGRTNIHRWRDGFLLLRMCWIAFLKRGALRGKEKSHP